MSRTDFARLIDPHLRDTPEDLKVDPEAEFQCERFVQRVSGKCPSLRKNLERLLNYHKAEELLKGQKDNLWPKNGNKFFSEDRVETMGMEIPEGELRFRRVIRVMEAVFAAQKNLSGSEEKIVPTPAQRRLVFQYILQAAPYIYGADWERCKEAFLLRYGLKDRIKTSLTLKPRRVGKTIAFAMFLAIMCDANVPGRLLIRYYSQSTPTCKQTLLKVQHFLFHYLRTIYPPEVINKLILTNKSSGAPELKVLHSSEAEKGLKERMASTEYTLIEFRACAKASTADLMRGGDVMIAMVDELESVHWNVLKLDILAHAKIENSCLIFASTPTTNEGKCAVLMKLRHSVTNKFLVHVTWEPSVCTDCTRLHKEDQCYHLLEPRPPHISDDNELQKGIMSKEEYDHEIGGLITSDTVPAFEPAWIQGVPEKSLMNLDRIRLPQRVPVVFLGVDPSGGAIQKSTLAISACYFTKNLDVVFVGFLDALIQKNRQEEVSIKTFVHKLRQQSAFAHSLFVVMVEVNMKLGAGAIRMYFPEELGPFYFPDFGGAGGEGPLTTCERKLDYMQYLNRLITATKIRFPRDIWCSVVIENEVVTSANDQSLLRELTKQFLAKMFEKTKNGRLKVSGKEGIGGVGTQRDDLLMSMAIAMNWGSAFLAQDNDLHEKLVRALQIAQVKGIYPLT
jgi:hypothetical protein